MAGSLRSIASSTRAYESWLGNRLTLVPADLRLKHRLMRAERFPFFRATYYRWAELWPRRCPDLAGALKVLAVGDLHAENFGTWRDAESRLVWGVNDFDEAYRLAYTHDLVRLASSCRLAIEEGTVGVRAKSAVDILLDGYRSALREGGRPFVLDAEATRLWPLVVHRLREPGKFWEKLESFPPARDVPHSVRKLLLKTLPKRTRHVRFAHRIAGLGSLGRQRFVAIGELDGARTVREAKALAPSAAGRAEGRGKSKLHCSEIMRGAIRSRDPYVSVRDGWILRRLAPDSCRIELSELSQHRDDESLLFAMGLETANVHLGSASASAITRDLDRRTPRSFRDACKTMLESLDRDWKAWRR